MLNDASALAERIPARIARLEELAYNFWWCWHREARDLFKTLDVSPAARDHGVDHERLPGLAEEIAANPYRFRNQPGPIDESRVLAFYEASWAGMA